MPALANGSFEVEKLPDDILREIFLRLDLFSMKTARLVCKRFFQITKSPIFKKTYVLPQPLFHILAPVKDIVIIGYQGTGKRTWVNSIRWKEYFPTIDEGMQVQRTLTKKIPM